MTPLAPNVHSRSSIWPKLTELLRAFDAEADDVRELALGARLEFDALIVDLETRVLPVPDAEAGQHARQRPPLERPLELDRRALGPAPREGHGQPLAHAEQIECAHPSAVREAVPVGVVEDRQEHQPAGHAPPRALERVRAAEGGGRDARALVDHEDDRDVGGVVERAVALADLHRVEPVAVLQAPLDRFQRVFRNRIADRDAGQLEHVFVEERRVPVHADLADGLDRLLVVS